MKKTKKKVYTVEAVCIVGVCEEYDTKEEAETRMAKYTEDNPDVDFSLMCDGEWVEE